MLNNHLVKLQDAVEVAIDMKQQYLNGLLAKYNCRDEVSLNRLFKKMSRYHMVMEYPSQTIEPEVREFMKDLLREEVKYIGQEELSIIQRDRSALDSHLKRAEASLAECERIMKYNKENGDAVEAS